ncbi:MAG: hypothetical protein JSU70_08935 [Phycisphaerales bacterium]|nr:MAG: hypothetical protein JSU70_08935 [Phycisphaerales bacterium]
MSGETGRFVVHEHTTDAGVHWDLMLEMGEALGTYRLRQAPAKAAQGPIGAVKILDHTLKFLAYEGPVQKGAGSVRLIDMGRYQSGHRDSDLIELRLAGQILTGQYVLTHVGGDEWEFAAKSRFE